MTRRPASAPDRATHRYSLDDDYQSVLEAFLTHLSPGWETSRIRDHRLAWRMAFRSSRPLPAQGWKLHISSSPPEMVELVRIVLPELVAFEVAFKLPATLDGVKQLNSGQAGASQIGKIVTVYPTSDIVLQRLVKHLDPLWRPALSPAIPSDLPVGEGGAFWIRYGAFLSEAIRTDVLGRPWFGIVAPDGTIVPDLRSEFKLQATWVPPPPIRPTERPPDIDPNANIIVNESAYLPLRILSNRPRGRVVLGLRLADRELAIIRTAVAGIACDEFGNDAVARLANEHRILQALLGSGIVPNVLGYDEAAHVLVLEDIDGRALDRLPVAERLSKLPAVLKTVARLHASGFVHRDLKPSNVLFGEQGARLIDLEVATEIGAVTPSPMGTNGYAPPKDRHAVVHPSYDVYSIGSFITHAMLDYCPSRLPASKNGGRQIGLLKLARRHIAANLAAKFLQSDAEFRPTALQAQQMLEARMSELLSEQVAERPRHDGGDLDRRWVRTVVTQAGIATRSFKAEQPIGHCWRNAHLFAHFELEGINLGAAGIIIGLVSIDKINGSTFFRDDVLGAADWLAAQPGNADAHGLFMGNAGVAVALALTGRRYRRPDLIMASRRRFELALSHAAADFDLFSGAAGILWSSCFLSAILGQKWPLALAKPQADRIRQAATRVDDILGWPAGKVYDPSGAVYVGAAHGTSGIALALADWGSRVGCSSSVKLALEAFARVFDHGRTLGRDNIIATTSGRSQKPQHWCHGVAGYLWCLLQAFGDPALLPNAKGWATSAFMSAAPIVDNPTYCHGLAGIHEIWRMLLDSPEHAPIASARAADIVSTFRLLHHHALGDSAWSSEDPSQVTPDLWLGFLGPAATLALHVGGVSSPVLSPRWLASCAA